MVDHAASGHQVIKQVEVGTKKGFLRREEDRGKYQLSSDLALPYRRESRIKEVSLTVDKGPWAGDRRKKEYREVSASVSPILLGGAR